MADAATATGPKSSGPSGRKPPAYVTFTQKYDPQYWQGWDPALIRSADAGAIGAEVLRRYEGAGGQAAGAWFITHDRDTQADGSIKDSHIHGVIQQSPGSKVEGKLHCAQIDAALGFATSVVRAPGRGARLENAQSYLIHAKDKDKFQYQVSDVETLRGQPYAQIEAAHRSAWARRAVMGRTAAVTQKEWWELGDALVQKVLDGEVNELDLLRDKTLTDVYTRNEARVNLALKNVARREMLEEVRRLREREFEKTIIWVMGASQQGKTYLAEGVADTIHQLTGWRVYRAAAKNASDKYRGEEVLVLNEPGSRAFEWPDLLTLLGPREAGPLSARYANKDDVAPRVVIVAVSVDPVDFGFFVPGKRSTGDSLDQLLLRIGLLVQAAKVDGEPRYSVSRLIGGEPYPRYVEVPGQYNPAERVELTARPIEVFAGLNRGTAISVIVDEVSSRSPGVIDPADLAIDQRVEVAKLRGQIAAAKRKEEE